MKIQKVMKKPIKKRGYHWFRMLTKKQKKQYKENIKNENLSNKGWEWWFNYRMNESDNAYIFFVLSFQLDKTPQGLEYWHRVIYRLENN